MKRTRTAVAAVAIAAVLAGGVWLAIGSGALGGGEPRPVVIPSTDVPPRPEDAVALTVAHVSDGDTIRATTTGATAFGPRDVLAGGVTVRVRLIGIDTPEGTPTVECGADEARDHLRELLPVGSRVWATTDREPRDRYGRVLLYLWTDDGTFVNHRLVASGDARALTVPPNTTHADLFAETETAARAASGGQWGLC